MNAVATSVALPRRAVRGVTSTASTDDCQFFVGQNVRYEQLGPGRIVARETRVFRGQPTLFIVIEFPHRDLAAHIPLGAGGLSHKLSPVSSKRDAEQLLAVIAEPGGAGLARLWDDRERAGYRRLQYGQPREWAELLRDYAFNHHRGMPITGSDHSLVLEAIDILAAEIGCAGGQPFAETRARVEAAYQSACTR